MHYSSLAIAVLVIAVGIAPVAAVPSQDRLNGAHGYQGQHVAYSTTSNAIVDYKVGGSTMMSSMEVQSAQSAGIGVDVGLSTVTNIVGADLTGLVEASTSATVKFGSGARVKTHDNGHGILVLQSGDKPQVVEANLSSDAEVTREGQDRVRVTTGEDTSGTFIVVGNGNLAINGEDNVTARIAKNGRLVYRTYPDNRQQSDKQQEQLIANGTAVGELYVQKQGQNDNGTDAVDVVSYSQDTTIEVKRRAKRSITYTAQRSKGKGKVFITSVTDSFGSAKDVNVTVDGEAAARADSYSSLAAATRGGGQSKYLVSKSSSAETSMDVVVAVDQFSKRDVKVSGSGGGGLGIPGFGLGVAIVALAGAVLLARGRIIGRRD